MALITLDVACGDLRHQPQYAILEIVPLEWVAAAEPALLRLDSLGVSFVLSVP
jgi:hypothetical protein